MLVVCLRVDELIKSTFRCALVTLFSIGIALRAGQTDGIFSKQQRAAISSMTGILLYTLLSTLLLAWTTDIGLFFSRWRGEPLQIAGAIGKLLLFSATVMIFASCTSSAFRFTNCDDIYVSDPGQKLLITGLAMFGMIVIGGFCLFYHARPFNTRTLGECMIIAGWLLAWAFCCAASELHMANDFFKDQDGNRVVLTSSKWGLGQVIAMVMLAIPLWDVFSYYVDRNRATINTVLRRFVACRRADDQEDHDAENEIQPSSIQCKEVPESEKLGV